MKNKQVIRVEYAIWMPTAQLSELFRTFFFGRIDDYPKMPLLISFTFFDGQIETFSCNISQPSWK